MQGVIFRSSGVIQLVQKGTLLRGYARNGHLWDHCVLSCWCQICCLWCLWNVLSLQSLLCIHNCALSMCTLSIVYMPVTSLKYIYLCPKIRYTPLRQRWAWLCAEFWWADSESLLFSSRIKLECLATLAMTGLLTYHLLIHKLQSYHVRFCFASWQGHVMACFLCSG